jgi:hypothetical protein
MYSVMQWTTDDNKVSVHHLKYVLHPKKPYNEYQVGDTGVAVFPGAKGEWDYKILALGGKTLFILFTTTSCH